MTRDARLDSFVDLFEKWNRRINLSAAATRDEVEEHLEDCLHVVPALAGQARVIDVGSGGGFPVVIAAICLPDSQFVSLEPIHKKHAFLRTAARELQLSNLDARAERVEDHASAAYDVAMSRATFDLADWFATGKRLVHAGGLVIGFEAQARADVPGERIAYEVRGKSRSLVLQRSI